MRYAVIIEWTENNYGAYAPDIPGCVATHKTEEGVKRLMKEAIEFHFQGMREDGDPIPEPTCKAFEVDVTVPEPLAAAA